MNDKPIFSAEVAGELMERGFELVKKRRDYSNPARWVYFFRFTPELIQAFTEITTARKANRRQS